MMPVKGQELSKEDRVGSVILAIILYIVAFSFLMRGMSGDILEATPNFILTLVFSLLASFILLMRTLSKLASK